LLQESIMPLGSSGIAVLEFYFVKLGGRVIGPFPGHQLRDIPGFTLAAFIRSVDSDQWQPAYRILDLNVYFPKPRPFNPSRSIAQTVTVPKPFFWEASEHTRPRFWRLSKNQIRWLILGFLLVCPSRIARWEDIWYEQRLDLMEILQPILAVAKSYLSVTP
jgi:hypothetical protein